MTHSTQLKKWGNSIGVTIPANIGKSLGYEAGMPINLTVENNRLIIEVQHPARHNWQPAFDNAGKQEMLLNGGNQFDDGEWEW